jgi:hypothetical protein
MTDDSVDTEQVARLKAQLEQARLDERLLHEMRGRCLAAMNLIDGTLGAFITRRYLRHEADEVAQQRRLHEWHGLILSRFSTDTRIAVFQGILKAQGKLDDKTKVLIGKLREANQKRNEVAHSSVLMWPIFEDDQQEPELGHLQTRSSRKGIEHKRLSLADVLADMKMLEATAAELSDFHRRAIGIKFPDDEEE